jgi:hypothetical protein
MDAAVHPMKQFFSNDDGERQNVAYGIPNGNPRFESASLGKLLPSLHWPKTACDHNE